MTTCHFAGRDRSVKSWDQPCCSNWISFPPKGWWLSRPWDRLDPNKITPKNEWKRVFKVLFARVDVNLLKGKWYILISSDFKLMDSIRYYQIRHWIMWDSPHVICTPSHQHTAGMSSIPSHGSCLWHWVAHINKTKIHPETRFSKIRHQCFVVFFSD